MPLIRMDAVGMFEDMGFRVLEASDGREALGILETLTAVSVLFTDIEMPHLGGLELAAIVAERWPQIEIVITSGRLEPCEDDMPNEARFLAKPYDPSALGSLGL
ncbi:response regulator [Shinella curvata]|uniref:Response regulator n=2 Tax=Shinella curvata TaxID=1817964 RepID=A0ABT8XMZ9_9HYPH|nr:response regulator [Shinella curvata]MDO6125102.1 response regulator [Shinella curvata]